MEITKEEWFDLNAELSKRNAEVIAQVLTAALQRIEETYNREVEAEKPDPAKQAEGRFKHYRALFANAAMQVLMEDKELPDEQIVKEAFQLADMMAVEANK